MNNDLNASFERNLEMRMDLLHARPMYEEQALTYSLDSAERFALEHGGALYPTSSREVLALARLDWLLRKYRANLSGKFTLEEITLLLNCFQREMFFPDQFDSIASDLCDDLGVELDTDDGTSSAPLIRKLMALCAGERVALGDALEQVWHRGMPTGKQPKEFLTELGIEVAAD